MAITERIQPPTWKPAPTHTPAFPPEFWAFAELVLDTPAILFGYLWRTIRDHLGLVVKRWRTSTAHDVGTPKRPMPKGKN